MSFLQIIDDDGAILPAGEEGNIAVRVQPTRPFCLFSEYLVSLSWSVPAEKLKRDPGQSSVDLFKEQNFIQDLPKVSLGCLRALSLISTLFCYSRNRLTGRV